MGKGKSSVIVSGYDVLTAQVDITLEGIGLTAKDMTNFPKRHKIRLDDGSECWAVYTCNSAFQNRITATLNQTGNATGGYYAAPAGLPTLSASFNSSIPDTDEGIVKLLFKAVGVTAKEDHPFTLEQGQAAIFLGQLKKMDSHKVARPTPTPVTAPARPLTALETTMNWIKEKQEKARDKKTEAKLEKIQAKNEKKLAKSQQKHGYTDGNGDPHDGKKQLETDIKSERKDLEKETKKERKLTQKVTKYAEKTAKREDKIKKLEGKVEALEAKRDYVQGPFAFRRRALYSLRILRLEEKIEKEQGKYHKYHTKEEAYATDYNGVHQAADGYRGDIQDKQSQIAELDRNVAKAEKHIAKAKEKQKWAKENLKTVKKENKELLHSVKHSNGNVAFASRTAIDPKKDQTVYRF